MAFTIDASEVVTQFGEYYKDEGQGVQDINGALRHSFETQNAFRVVETENDVLDNVNAEFGEVIQSFQDTYTPKGTVTLLPNRIPTFDLKVDISVKPDSLKHSWVEFFTSKNLDRSTWPFIRWLIEVYLMGQIQQDLELEAIFSGVYKAPTAGTANAAKETMDGIKKLLNAKIDADKITPITTGALKTDPAQFCTQIEEFVEAVPALYRAKPFELNMSDTLATRYRKGRQAKYNMNYAQVGDLMQVDGRPNVSLRGHISHEGSEKIWGGPKTNAILAFKGLSNLKDFKVETSRRMVDIFTDWRVGLGWLYDTAIFTNDQDLTPVEP